MLKFPFLQNKLRLAMNLYLRKVRKFNFIMYQPGFAKWICKPAIQARNSHGRGRSRPHIRIRVGVWLRVLARGKANEKESFCAFSLSILLYCCYASAKAEAQLRAARDYTLAPKGYVQHRKKADALKTTWGWRVLPLAESLFSEETRPLPPYLNQFVVQPSTIV